jgi:dolichol-phosphate mannosyltransferase
MVSVVVPTYNEANNIRQLLALIGKSFGRRDAYEILVVDDHSTDGTREILEEESAKYPLRILLKKWKKGKAYSLIQGLNEAKGEILAMIDADLQYPPEAIVEMVKLLKNADVVVANRKTYEGSLLRKTLSRTFRFAFGKLLFNLDCDIQSGLKVFRREVFDDIKFNPKSPWSFDLEFLNRAKQAGYKIENFDIFFSGREEGASKISFVKGGFELATAALAHKIQRVKPLIISSDSANSMKGAGVAYGGKDTSRIQHLSIMCPRLLILLLGKNLRF